MGRKRLDLEVKRYHRKSFKIPIGVIRGHNSKENRTKRQTMVYIGTLSTCGRYSVMVFNATFNNISGICII
jgi:hypothetical protein